MTAKNLVMESTPELVNQLTQIKMLQAHSRGASHMPDSEAQMQRVSEDLERLQGQIVTRDSISHDLDCAGEFDWLAL